MARAATIFLPLLIAIPLVSSAQNKDEVRATAKTNAAALRAAGEPMDRCSLSANIGPGPVVIRTHGLSPLKAGDKLLAIDGTAVAGSAPDAVIAVLRRTAPTATVSISVERDGKPTTVPVACSNSRATIEPLVAALDLAARGKFDECVDVVSRIPNLDTNAAALRLDCSSLSRKVGRTEVAARMAEVAEMAIQDARHAPSTRNDVVKQLRNFEGVITQGQGAARYQALVAATRQWPGDETLYASTAPDWKLFRRNAEQALRSRLIDPESARIEWTHGFLSGTWKPFLSKPVEGYWSCGLINARNRMGGYTGSTAFVVVLDPSGYVKYSEIGSSRDIDILSASCSKSVALLPPAPPELKDGASQSEASATSLADELKKLSDLRTSGALSEAEFQAAKAKLLGN